MLKNLDSVSKIITSRNAHTNEYHLSAMAKKGSPDTTMLVSVVDAIDSSFQNALSMDDMDTKLPAPSAYPCCKVPKSTHADTMRRMGYDTSMPPLKRPKNNCELLVDACPCPPDYQHKI